MARLGMQRCVIGCWPVPGITDCLSCSMIKSVSAGSGVPERNSDLSCRAGDVVRRIIYLLAAVVINPVSWAQPLSLDTCLLVAVQSAAEDVTVGELREACRAHIAAEAASTQEEPLTERRVEVAGTGAAEGGISKRLTLQRYTRDNPFVLTPNRPNYLLPMVYVNDPNEDPLDSNRRELKHVEVEFQLSLEVMLWESILGRNLHLSAAYTNRSFWQAYNSNLSSAFRETNHEPELILTFENDWEILGFTNVANQIILNHQSNGQDLPSSRSWNRIMANFLFERDNFVFSFKPWYRLRESKKRHAQDTGGDDNPDIERYLGHFEWLGGWQYRNNNFSLMLRNNLRSDNRGAAELSWSFPIGGRIRGYVKYFNGYGNSLIDYDAHIESLGVGFLLTEWF